MNDYQRIVEFLRDFRTSAVQTVTDEVREAATVYAQLCGAANDRLRQCASLLQRGLRSEAVHQAEVSPNLLDLVAALDLPDPEGWAELCQRTDLPVPPTLQMERAAQLNDAYGQDQPLAQLYAAHRRLALGHGPLVQRLDVMRQIARADPSPFWEADLRSFEHARFKQIRVAFTMAIARKDVASVTALSKEVLETPWVDPAPPDLASAAKDVHGRVELARFGTELTDVMARLQAAYAGKSLPQCVSLLNQARELATSHSETDISEETAVVLRTVGGWVQQQQQAAASRQAYAAACETLTAVLDTGANNGELEAAHRTFSSLGQQLPPDLSDQYNRAIRQRASAVRWKYAAVFFGVVVLAGIVLGVMYWRNQASLAEDWARRIERATAQRDTILARQLVEEQERLAPEFNDIPAVAAAKHQVTAMAEQLARDKSALAAALTLLQDASQEAATAEASAPAEPQALLAAAAAADEVIARSKSIPDAGRIDSAKRLATGVARLKDQSDELRRRASAAVLARTEAATRALYAIRVERNAAGMDEVERKITAIQRDLEAIRPYYERDDQAQAKTVAAAAMAKIASLRNALQLAREESEARKTLASAAGSVATARDALRQFATRLPASPLSQDFSRAAADADLYESIEQWHLVSAVWGADPSPPSEKSATEWLDLVRNYQHDHPLSPMVPRAAAYALYLERASEAMAAQNVWQLGMSEVLAAPLMSELKVLQGVDGTRYYVLGDPKVKKTGLEKRARYTFEAIDPQNLAKRRTVTLPLTQGLTSEKPAPAAHVQYVRTLAEQLKTVDPSAWETWGIDLIDRIVREESLEPVVKGILLREALLSTARADAWGIGNLYERPIADLVRQRLDQIVWYDPDQPVPDVTIANLKAIFARVPKADDVRKIVLARRAELFQSIRPGITGMGMLLRDDDGQWQVVAPSGSRLGDSAFAVVPPPAIRLVPVASQPASVPAASQPIPVPASLIVVAHRQGNVMVVDESAARGLPQGTMVFFAKP